MDLVAGDLLPPLTFHLFDGAVPYDATTDTVTVKAWVNDVQVISRTPTSVSADGTVVMNWVAGDTNEPGPMYVRVVCTKTGFKPATFPPRGYLTVNISPAAP